ncbi:hypothetical protein GCM10023169_06450 [Georgenia halophila]|uniref:SURF1-like protein n=1 Tax=Georgenia halophila TaxID=620889 RepID=A0ABP8KVT6_9MICO
MSARAVLLAVATAVLAVLAVPPAYATPTPGAPVADPQAEPDVPSEVARWFRTQGWEVLANRASSQLELEPGQRDEATLGLVRTVSTWSPGYIAGTDPDPPTVEAEQWISPVRLDSQGVGVLQVSLGEDGEVGDASLMPTAGLADVLLSLAPGDLVIHDPVLDAWFTIMDGEVRPLDDAAQNSLAGTLPVEAYQPFVADRYRSDTGTGQQPADTVPTWEPVAWAGSVLLLLLAWAATIVWLRRDSG